MTKRKNDQNDIINDVILTTAHSRELVIEVVEAFLSSYQNRVSEGTVYIQGFGEMRGTIAPRRYYDINNGGYGIAENSKVIFRPSEGFLNLVKHSRKESQIESAAE